MHVAESDYEATTSNSELIFTCDQRVPYLMNISIEMEDDSLTEQDETFSVMLTTGDEAVSLAPSIATVNIIDNDSK